MFFKPGKFKVVHLILVLWLIFSTAYVAYSEYKRIQFFIAKQAYNKGVEDSISKLMVEAAKCQPVPVTLAGQRIDLMAMNCLENPETQDAPTQ